ncbi:MAG: S8 family serine peptidase [Chloroflexi bacterium]|nr:S8 family serine peptidase [Chloroflexota bacterium]
MGWGVRSSRQGVRWLLIALVLALSGMGLDAASAQGPTEFVTGEILVQFQPGTPAPAIADIHRQNGGRVKQTIAGINVQVVSVPAGQERARVAAYARNPNVRFAELNGIYHAIGATNDPLIGRQWQYQNTGQTDGTPDADMDAFEAWDVTAGSAAVALAILDTGVDQSHEDLASKIAGNVNFTDSGTVDDLYGHGTHVAGSAAAASNNGTGVAGTCPNCSLYNVKVLNDRGSGAWSWIANGILWAAGCDTSPCGTPRAPVINMSLGGSSGSVTLQQAIDQAWGNGVVLAAAAGNDGVSDPSYPAFYTNVIAVAATDHNDAKPGWSNFGSWVDVAAPGAAILSTAPDHRNRIFGGNAPKYGTISGTSMATPHVAGVAGLVWSTALCAARDNACVRSQVETTADRIAGTGTLWTHGRINARSSVTPTNRPPTVSIVDPTEGQTIVGAYRVKVAAADADGSVSTVELSIDGGAFIDLTANFDGTHYFYDWDTPAVADGSRRLDARATDNAGQVGVATTVTVTVDNVDSPPTASIVNPATGATVRGTVIIQASATDDKGISAVEYAIDGGAYAPMSFNSASGAWEASWDTTGYADGSAHTIDVRATDSAAQVGQAAQVTVMVDNAVRSLAVTVTTDKGTYSVGEQVTIDVTVADNAGSPVADAAVRLEVFAPNGSLYASGNSTTDGSGRSRFRLKLHPRFTAPGVYTVVATATKDGYTAGEGRTTFTVQ